MLNLVGIPFQLGTTKKTGFPVSLYKLKGYLQVHREYDKDSYRLFLSVVKALTPPTIE